MRVKQNAPELLRKELRNRLGISFISTAISPSNQNISARGMLEV
jgi:hypothetical protein